MEGKHTPGPWKHNAIKPFTDFQGKYHSGKACAVWSADGLTPIATTMFGVGKYEMADCETRAANAALIAAAPAMLSSLDRLTVACGEAEALHHAGLVVPADVWAEMYHANLEARAAIAQAKGVNHGK